MPFAKLTSLLAALCAAGAIGVTRPAPQAQSGAPAATATVAPTQPTFRATDRIGVTADARNMGRVGSNFRIYTVPVGTPDDHRRRQRIRAQQRVDPRGAAPHDAAAGTARPQRDPPDARSR